MEYFSLQVNLKNALSLPNWDYFCISGWGERGDQGEITPLKDLQFATVHPVSSEDCFQRYFGYYINGSVDLDNGMCLIGANSVCNPLFWIKIWA